MAKMKVLMVSAEVEPFAKTGGLGDVVGSLPKALNENGMDARVIMPLYGKIADKFRKTEADCKNTPEYVAYRNKAAALTRSVSPGAEEEGCEGSLQRP